MSFASILKGLTAQGRKVAYFMHSDLVHGVKKAASLASHREITPYIMRKDFFSRDWGVIKKAQDAWTGMKFVGRKSIIRAGYEQATVKFDTQYDTIVSTKLFNRATGREELRRTHVYHNAPLEREFLEDRAWDIVTKEGEYDLERIDARPVGGFASA